MAWILVYKGPVSPLEKGGLFVYVVKKQTPGEGIA